MTQDPSQNQNPLGFFLIIPEIVASDPDLPPAAVLFFGRLTQLTQNQGYCWASNAYLAELCNVDESTIKRWLSSLHEKKYINIDTQKKGFQTNRKIYTYLSDFQKTSTEAQKSASRGLKNDPPRGSEMPPKQYKPNNIKKTSSTNADVDDSSNDEEGGGVSFIAKWQFLCQSFPQADEQILSKLARSYAIESLKTAFNWTQSQNPENPIAYYQWALKNPAQWLYKANKPKEKIAKDKIEELQEKKEEKKKWFREFVIKNGIGQYSDVLWVVCPDSLKIKGEKKQYLNWLENGFAEQVESIFRKEGWI